MRFTFRDRAAIQSFVNVDGMRCSADPLVGESQHAVVAYVNDERGYGYLKDDAGQKVGISRKFLGEELFARLRLGVEVRYIGNGRGAAAAIRILD